MGSNYDTVGRLIQNRAVEGLRGRSSPWFGEGDTFAATRSAACRPAKETHGREAGLCV